MSDLVGAVRALDPTVRSLADPIEAGRRVPAHLAADIGRTGMWLSCVPKAVGGSQTPLAEVLEAIEVLGRADGSTGWVAMICATTGLIYAYLDPAVAGEMIATDPCSCGVFAPSGQGAETDGGLTVSGRWAFCSGVENAAWVTLGVVVDGGVKAIVVPASDVEIVDTWTVSGLRGTGSHHVQMQDVFVPAERTFDFGGAPKSPGPLYTFPLFGLLALGVAAVALGIARSSIDELTALASAKTPAGSRRRLADRSHIQMEVAKATAELGAARTFVFQTVAEAWVWAEQGDVPSLEQRAHLRLAATHATRTSADVVDRMYDAGGGTSVYATSRLQRDFRDIHAATQHMVVAPATYELAGRILLGVETDTGQL